jgi:hypothetical protein
MTKEQRQRAERMLRADANGAVLKTRVICAMVHAGVDDKIVARAETLTFPAKPRLLGTSKKTEAGEKGEKVLTAVVYLAPFTMSVPFGGFNVCQHATPGCAKACLGHDSGRLTMDSSRNAQLWKTLVRRWLPEVFRTMLTRELAAHQKKADKKGFTAAARLDGSSDLGDAKHYTAAFPRMQFYDYTKSMARAILAQGPESPPNYHVTFSMAESNESACQRVAQLGGNVATVFRTRDENALPAEFLGLPVINGNETDVRFRDPQGCVVGLTCKGPKAMKDTSGFVKEV